MPESYFQDVLHRQAVVNRGVTFRLRVQRGGAFETTDYCYADGILDYVKELAGEDALTVPTFIETERRGRDRADKPEYKVKISAAFCFSNRVNDIEYYHNSSWLEYGGAPEKPRRAPSPPPSTPTSSSRVSTRKARARSAFRTCRTV